MLAWSAVVVSGFVSESLCFVSVVSVSLGFVSIGLGSVSAVVSAATGTTLDSGSDIVVMV